MRKNVHLTGTPVKGALFLFLHKTMFTLLCLQLLLLIYCCDVDNIKTMFLESLSLSTNFASWHKRRKKRSVFCYTCSFDILFLEKYILPVCFSLQNLFCPNRHWKTKSISAVWIFWGVLTAVVLHWTKWKLYQFMGWLIHIKLMHHEEGVKTINSKIILLGITKHYSYSKSTCWSSIWNTIYKAGHLYSRNIHLYQNSCWGLLKCWREN